MTDILGTPGNDVLAGGIDNDLLNGQHGADKMSGGGGNDIYIVDEVGDSVTEAANQGRDSVLSAVTNQLGANVEDLHLIGDALNGTGNTLNNVIVGNARDNTLDGGVGNDNLRSGGGKDVLIGGAGNDQLFGEAGDHTMSGGDGNDFLDGGDGNNLLRGGAGDDFLGASGEFGDGPEILEGGTGNDQYSLGDGDKVVELAGQESTRSGQASPSICPSTASTSRTCCCSAREPPVPAVPQAMSSPASAMATRWSASAATIRSRAPRPTTR